MNTETLIALGVVGYLLLKSKSGPMVNCPGSPGCPGYGNPSNVSPVYTAPNLGSSVTSAPGGTLLQSDYPVCPNGTVTVLYIPSTDQFQATCGPYQGVPVIYGTQ